MLQFESFCSVVVRFAGNEYLEGPNEINGVRLWHLANYGLCAIDGGNVRPLKSKHHKALDLLLHEQYFLVRSPVHV